jgi:hypothetical protein
MLKVMQIGWELEAAVGAGRGHSKPLRDFRALGIDPAYIGRQLEGLQDGADTLDAGLMALIPEVSTPILAAEVWTATRIAGATRSLTSEGSASSGDPYDQERARRSRCAC